MAPRTVRILLAVLVVAHIAASFRYHVALDSAHLNFRYADNLASGHGLVWNPGERVDGYTSFLWTLLLAPFLRFGVDAITAATLLATVATASLVPLTFAIARRLGCREPTAIGAAAITALSPYPAFAAGTGMETAAFAAVLAAATLTTLRVLDGDAAAVRTGTLLALLTLLRPEGALLAAVLLMALVLVRERRPQALRAAGAFAALVLPCAAWHAWYYGSVLPMAPQWRIELSYAHLGEGLAYVTDAGSLAGAGGLLLLPFALASDRRGVRVLFVSSLVWLGYLITTGGEAMPMFRLMIPAFALLVALAACGFDRALPPGFARTTAGLIAIAIAIMPSADPSPSISWLKYADKRAEHEVLQTIGKVLDAELPKGSTLATGIAGTVGYYASEIAIINTFGVTDAHIAATEPDRSAAAYYGFERGDGSYLWLSAPDYVMTCSMLTITPQRFAGGPVAQAGGLFRFKSERELWSQPEFRQRYEMISLDAPGGGYVNLFRRRRTR